MEKKWDPTSQDTFEVKEVRVNKYKLRIILDDYSMVEFALSQNNNIEVQVWNAKRKVYSCLEIDKEFLLREFAAWVKII